MASRLKERKKTENTDTVSSPNTLDGTDNAAKEKMKRKIIAVESDGAPLTELWSNVLVVGDEPWGFPALLARARCTKAESIATADIILFTGGWEDVSPELYGEERHEKTTSDPKADMRDIKVFQEAAYLGIPMIGVCRGAQFLHVMNGGKLYQHVDGHNTAHDVYLPDTDEYLTKISSVHHQMCRPNEANGMKVLAVAYEAEVKWLNPNLSYTGLHRCGDEDIEAFWYPETACFGVQGHPEYTGFNDYSFWFTNMIEELMIMNTDIELVNNRRRLKQEIIHRRKWRMPETVYEFTKKHR